jgi:2-polyprenyl-3-methyl-5-hydroxy-6-metoxy-1,4-benzoquinol methylase
MYENKDKAYFSNPRIDLIGLIPQKVNNKVLEIGAGSCDTLIEIKKLGLAEEVVGVELLKLPESNQENSGIDKLIICNIEDSEIDLPHGYFDVIICGDVIEHLIDPWSTLKKLGHYLKPDGILILSIPNLREYHILYRILFLADFKYTNQGIMDRTHLRFFCKKNIISLVKSALFTPISIYPIFKLEVKKRGKRLLDTLTFGLIRDFLTSQYVVVAKKSEYL